MTLPTLKMPDGQTQIKKHNCDVSPENHFVYHNEPWRLPMYNYALHSFCIQSSFAVQSGRTPSAVPVWPSVRPNELNANVCLFGNTINSDNPTAERREEVPAVYTQLSLLVLWSNSIHFPGCKIRFPEANFEVPSPPPHSMIASLRETQQVTSPNHCMDYLSEVQ
jgi:hypothetical protein